MSKQFLGTLRDLYTYRYFNDMSKAPRYRGVYATHAAAHAALPANQPQGFNIEAAPDYFIKCEFLLNPADYPVLFWLSKAMQPNANIFDLGGGMGQCYYSYQPYLSYPPELRWTVCDVESFVERGPKVARERNATQLSFTSDFHDADGVPIFLSNGALHYIEPDLSEMLGPLKKKPQHILINRIPVYGGEQYFTQQNAHHSYSVNKVMNESQFVRGIENLGYRLADSWRIQRILRIPFHPERLVSHYRGFYFRERALRG